MKFKHIKFADALTQRIAVGEFPSGIFLPSERDLAAEYQVSRITVRKGLKLLLGKKILQTESTRGYKVLSIPDHPGKTKINIGGLWCSGIYDEHTFDLYNSAGALAFGKGYTFFLNYTSEDCARQAAALAEILEKKIDGLLIVPTYSKQNDHMTLGNHALIRCIRASGIPLVMLDRDFPEKDLPCVVNDEYGGGVLAAEHLAKLGHKKVLLLASFYHYYISERRFSGFCSRCSELGVEVMTHKIPYEIDGKWVDPWKSYCEHRAEIRKTIRNSNITAILVNIVRHEMEILNDLEDLELDFMLYDSKGEGCSKRNVWCVRRPTEEISRKAFELLLKERRKSSQKEIIRIRLLPEIVPLKKINNI